MKEFAYMKELIYTDETTDQEISNALSGLTLHGSFQDAVMHVTMTDFKFIIYINLANEFLISFKESVIRRKIPKVIEEIYIDTFKKDYQYNFHADTIVGPISKEKVIAIFHRLAREEKRIWLR